MASASLRQSFVVATIFATQWGEQLSGHVRTIWGGQVFSWSTKVSCLALSVTLMNQFHISTSNTIKTMELD